MYLYIYIYIHTHAHTCTYVYIGLTRACVRVRVYPLQRCTRPQVTEMLLYTYTYIYIYIYIYIYTHTHTHICTYIYIGLTRACVRVRVYPLKRCALPQVTWPLQDMVLLRGFCARINHPFIAPSHLHCPHYFNTIARLLRSIRRPPGPPFVCHAPYNICNGNKPWLPALPRVNPRLTRGI